MTANANLATVPIGGTDRCNTLLPGCRLDEYQIDTLLGSGGFGVTYKAWDTLLATWVAIKEYFPMAWSFRDHDGVTIYANTQGETPSNNGTPISYYLWGLERFLDEARILARIQHPCVVRVKRYFRAHGTAYIVMDYEEGKPLSALLHDGDTLSEQDVRGLLEDVLPALRAVHEQGFLHRDIKPSNLYVRDRDHRVMLIDFGAARQAVERHTESITSLVTPGYSPPEQYTTRIDRHGAWTDIYALGAVLYRCVTGDAPLEAAERMLGDHLEPTVVAARAAYSAQLLKVIDQALSVRPEQRFASVADMEAALTSAYDAVEADDAVEDDDATVILEPIKLDRVVAPVFPQAPMCPLTSPASNEPTTDSNDLQILPPADAKLELISTRLDVLKLPAQKVATTVSNSNKIFWGGSLALASLIGLATMWWALSGPTSQKEPGASIAHGQHALPVSPASPDSRTVELSTLSPPPAAVMVSSNTSATAPELVAKTAPVASSAEVQSPTAPFIEASRSPTPEMDASKAATSAIENPVNLPSTGNPIQQSPTAETVEIKPVVETVTETEPPSSVLPAANSGLRSLNPETVPASKAPAKVEGKTASRRPVSNKQENQSTANVTVKPRVVRQQHHRKSPPLRQPNPIISSSTQQKPTAKHAVGNPWELPATTGFNQK